jgi:hypothetical protein
LMWFLCKSSCLPCVLLTSLWRVNRVTRHNILSILIGP